MAVPTNEAFKSAISMLGNVNASFLMPAFKIEVFRDFDPTVGNDLLRITRRTLNERQSAAEEHEVIRWIESQESFQSIEKRIKKGRRKASDAEWIATSYDSLHKIAIEREHEKQLLRFTAAVHFTLDCHPMSYVNWVIGVVRALRIYYHADYTARMQKNRRQLQSRIDAATAGIQAIIELKSDPFARAASRKIQQVWSRGGDALGADYEDLAKVLAALRKLGAQHVYPISRFDETAKERLFAYQIDQVNRLRLGKPYSWIISELMRFEGFRATLDDRNIEKYVSQWGQPFDPFSLTRTTVVDEPNS